MSVLAGLLGAQQSNYQGYGMLQGLSPFLGQGSISQQAADYRRMIEAQAWNQLRPPTAFNEAVSVAKKKLRTLREELQDEVNDWLPKL